MVYTETWQTKVRHKVARNYKNGASVLWDKEDKSLSFLAAPLLHGYLKYFLVLDNSDE